jgi:lipoprotein-anchoring transpeptidase ErfK/SrfK
MCRRARVARVSGCEELETAQRTASSAARTATDAVRAVIPLPAPAGRWEANGIAGSPKIVVHLNEQKAYFYKGKHLVGESTISTGMKGFSTPPGHYTVLQKDKDHFSSVFGDYVDDGDNVVKLNIDVRKDRKPPGAHFDAARMPYFMRFRGGYGMHAGYVPPYRASHGCIRLPQNMARHFFNAAREGTPVIVRE